ncbi:MAG TPA: TAT-variant-translocated molybdopterin oxidoreductase [Ferruginibacter sp.]|nr:TAT-variant-translocated molybdopterin oxidoreductase [Ferruginibacter sp.]
MSKKKYWQSFGELNQTESFQESTKNEFKEELLPLADLDDKGILDAKSPRRDFLKYLGFSTAAAAVAASCEMPVRKAVPYLKRPDDVIPGVANYYASTYVNGGDTISVVVKQRDGRPIKIEGNELSSITKGGTSAQAQASVLDLYDNTRLRYPMQKDGKGFKEVTSFDAFDKMVAGSLANVAGKPVVLLTSTVNSPSTLAIINEFLAKYPGSRHVQYDAVSYSGMLLANEICYGKKAIPSYHFENAKVIVSLGADFLGTWLSPVEFSGQYAQNRKVSGEKPTLSRHFHFESMMSMTGSNADDRYTHKPSETGAVALALAAALGVAVPAQSTGKLPQNVNDGIAKAAAELKANSGAALVVCGSNDVNIQMIVNAINEQIGANGKTINWGVTSNYKNGSDADMMKLVDEMNAGSIGAVFIHGVNPAYTLANSKKFKDGLSKVVSVSFNGTMDETTELCKYIIPSHHWLESWGDAEPKTGYYSLLQPVINPLFKTRAFQTSLIKWSAAAGSAINDYETYFKTYWSAKLGTPDLYNKALQDGVVEPATMPVGAGTFNVGKLSEAATGIAAIKTGANEVVLYQKVSVGDGSQANNPWLQELPDPISKVTWDNYVMMSPAMAKSLLGLDVMNQDGGKQSDYEVHPEKPVVKVTGENGAVVELPVIVLPGLNKDTIAIALGYGRESANKEETATNIGRSANGAGKNAYPLVGFNGTNSYSSTCRVEKTGATYPLAQTQVHGFTESRPVLFETNLTSYTANPESILEEVNKEREAITIGGSKDFVKDATIYPDYEKPGIKWGMSIDLNTCTGCSACVVACTAENNVSVVGKMQVQRAHEMHWLRIDRYFTGDLENPDVVFQPMLCQHCDNAPCENVCPVAATNHSTEGLNQMTYNRCIGTRYCANNCPYKVRRFNWLDYTGADSFPDNQNPMVGAYMDESVLQMNDDLTRMVLNPDVTVRSRGVIEKCSFCVQRLQESKLEAKKHQDPTMVRNVKTACMQACPTHAISFGNVNDKESDVYKIRNVEQKHRSFYVLEQLHVLPNVSYLAKVRNTDRYIGVEEGHGEKSAEPKKETKAHA